MANRVEIAKYIISIGGSPISQNVHPAWVNILDTNDKRYLIRFHHSEKELPPDGTVDGLYVVNMPVAVLSHVIDTLRNERPVYLAVEDKRTFLVTEKEDVGANE